MAKGNRGNRVLRRYGYPTDRHLRREAAMFANASLPTVRSIHREYDRAQQDNSGFSDALLQALKDSTGDIGAAYDTANTQQGALDTATQARLSELDPSFAGSVGTVLGGKSDSARAGLVAQGAAARTAAAKQPGIAAAQAYLGHETLLSNEQDAMQKRRDAFRSSYAQMLQQVEAEALQRASFVASRQDARFSRNEARRSDAMQQQGLDLQAQGLADSEQAQSWSQSMDRQNFRAQYGYDPITGKIDKKSPRWDAANAAGGGSSLLKGFTASDLRDYAKMAGPLLNPLGPSQSVTTRDAATGKTSTSTVRTHTPTAPLRGVPFTTFLSNLEQAGLPPAVALYYAQGLYSQYSTPAAVVAQMHDLSTIDGRGWPPPKDLMTSTLAAAHQSYLSYQQFLEQQSGQQTSAPSTYGGGGGGGRGKH